MVKEAQLECVHSSFNNPGNKRFDIVVSTRKLEQYWLSPQAFTGGIPDQDVIHDDTWLRKHS